MLAPVAEADAGERALLELGLRSAAAWPAFAQELQEASGKEVGYRESGTLVVARDRDEAEALEREAALREELGLRVERLLPSAARRLEPALAPSLRAAVLAPDDHTVDPRRLTAALAIAAARAGVEYRVGQEISAVMPGEGIEIEGRQTVLAEQVVVCGGAWSGGIPGVPAVPVRPVKGQTLRLRGDAPLLERPVRYEGGYLVPRGDGELVVGATVEEQGFSTTLTAGGLHELLRDASELVPGVLELEVDRDHRGPAPRHPGQRAAARGARRGRLRDGPPPQRRAAHPRHGGAGRGAPRRGAGHRRRVLPGPLRRGGGHLVILVNGTPNGLVRPGSTVRAMLDVLGMDEGARGVAVAVDAEVVPRAAWSTFTLADDARVEVLTAVQGG